MSLTTPTTDDGWHICKLNACTFQRLNAVSMRYRIALFPHLLTPWCSVCVVEISFSRVKVIYLYIFAVVVFVAAAVVIVIVPPSRVCFTSTLLYSTFSKSAWGFFWSRLFSQCVRRFAHSLCAFNSPGNFAGEWNVNVLNCIRTRVSH